jgi:hypothetical protein
MDVARWAIKDATLPTKVWSLGGRFGYADQGQTPNTQMAVMEFGDVLLVFEVRGLVGGKSKDKARVDNECYTTEGRIAGGRFYPKSGGPGEKLADCGGEVRPGGAFGSFIEAVRSRKQEDLNADVLEGHYSSALCHLANISYRLGEKVSWDQKPPALAASATSNRQPPDKHVVAETFAALENNLTGGVGLSLDGLTYQLGRTLSFDPAAEKFVKDTKADQLLTREYRSPFAVPEKV